MDSNRQIKLSIVISYITIAVNILVGLLYTPWLIRSIGREDFGLYTLAGSIIAFFMFDFGLSSAITRFLTKYLSEGKIEQANNCVGLVYKLYFYIDLLFLSILSAIYFFIPDIYQKLTPEEIEKFKVVYVIASIYSVIVFPFIPLNGILSAYEKFIPLQLADMLNKLGVVAIMSICLLLGYGLYALVLVNAIVGLATIIIKLFSIKKYTNSKANFGYRNKTEFKEIVFFSGWSTVVSVSQRLVLPIIPSVLGIISGSSAIAIFGIAMTIEGYSYTFSSVIGGPFLPKVTRVIANDEKDLFPLMIKVGRIQYIFVGAIVIGFICLGNEFVLLWVGEGFRESSLCAALMMFPSFLSTPEDIAHKAVLAQNKIKNQAVAYLITTVVNLVLLSIFAKLWGAVGAALSVFISYTLRWMLMNIIFYRDLDIDVFCFYKETLLRMCPSFILTIVLGLLLNYLYYGVSWMGFIIKMFLFTFIYIISIYFVLNNYEKGLLLGPIKRAVTLKKEK